MTQLNTDPVIGSQLSSSIRRLMGRPFLPPGINNVQQLNASPATISFGATNLAAGGLELAFLQNGNANVSAISVTGAGNPQIAGTVFPDNGLVAFDSMVGTNSQVQNGSNLVRLSVVFSSAQATPILSLSMKSLSSAGVMVKVNDKYLSLTPTSIGNTGTVSFLNISFAAPGTYRVDIIGDNILNTFRIGSMFGLSATDTIAPAPIRGGRRIIIMGDSIPAATGAGAQALGYPQAFAEYMGWDDVWPSGDGGTGLVNPGASVNYQARVQSDVIAFSPDEVIITGFTNDLAQTPVRVGQALVLLIQTILNALPNCRITFFGPYASFGVGNQGGSNIANPNNVNGLYVANRSACQAAVASFNSPMVQMIDPTTMQFYSTSTIPATPVVFTTTVANAASATTISGISQNGAAATLNRGFTYEWLTDGSRFRCLTTPTGSSAGIDFNQNAQPIGAQFKQCAPCIITGFGFAGSPTGVGNADLLVIADHIHPTPLYHYILGTLLGQYYTQLLDLYPA